MRSSEFGHGTCVQAGLPTNILPPKPDNCGRGGWHGQAAAFFGGSQSRPLSSPGGIVGDGATAERDVVSPGKKISRHSFVVPLLRPGKNAYAREVSGNLVAARLQVNGQGIPLAPPY